jgi:hypothetical protein
MSRLAAFLLGLVVGEGIRRWDRVVRDVDAIVEMTRDVQVRLIRLLEGIRR